MKDKINDIEPKLGLFDTTMIVVSLVIGIGIFRTPSLVANAAGSESAFFLAWVIGGVIALFGGLTYAEIGCRKPMAGGYYKIVSESFHPALAFMLNWIGIILVQGAGMAAVAILGSEYIQPFIPLDFFQGETGLQWLAGMIILLLFLINFAGLKMGARVLNAITVIKIVMILLFSLLGLLAPEVAPVAVKAEPSAFNFAGIGIALISVFYTCGGYQSIMNMGGDVINPRKNFPRAVIGGVAIIFFLYLSINVGYVAVLGFEGVKSANLIAADMAEVVFGEVGRRIVSVTIFISVLGFINATLMQLPRAYHAMAQDDAVPRLFMKVNPKTQVQEFALSIFTGLVLFFIITQGKFDQIINLVMFNDTLILATAAAAIFVLRKKMKDESYNGFKVPLYPVIPAVFILFLLIVSFNALLENPMAALVSTLFLLAGFPIFLLLRKVNSKKDQ
ncbi:amino acid permease [Imperialibacter roseus]|uniref:Amino acid permease n=1 Tax=Imperialibacter roseus TaxID=1324217 RepID=A0ABZ0IXZ3_9BACT|nr:amino acid permease [Imperialibacter roseus]WOK09264.1 amino acid permease [Imperialibacter roseus]|tara:strand:- start:14196 stop:15536 length:1341 start_codon:yes stop_codon:yes gene_type:complete